MSCSFHALCLIWGWTGNPLLPVPEKLQLQKIRKRKVIWPAERIVRQVTACYQALSLYAMRQIKFISSPTDESCGSWLVSWTVKNVASCASSIMAPGSRCAMPPSVGSTRLPLLAQCHGVQTAQAWESWPEARLSPPSLPVPFIISWYSCICPLLFKGLHYFHLHKLVKTNLLPYYPLNWFRSDLLSLSLSPTRSPLSPQPIASLNWNPNTTCAPSKPNTSPFNSPFLSWALPAQHPIFLPPYSLSLALLQIWSKSGI